MQAQSSSLCKVELDSTRPFKLDRYSNSILDRRNGWSNRETKKWWDAASFWHWSVLTGTSGCRIWKMDGTRHVPQVTPTFIRQPVGSCRAWICEPKFNALTFCARGCGHLSATTSRSKKMEKKRTRKRELKNTKNQEHESARAYLRWKSWSYEIFYAQAPDTFLELNLFSDKPRSPNVITF